MPNEKSQTMFNRLNPAQVERLSLLLEELGEVQQVIGKILRHGYMSFNPNRPQDGTNLEMLEKELGDVGAAMELMADCGDIKKSSVQRHGLSKLKRVQEYLHHNKVNPNNVHDF